VLVLSSAVVVVVGLVAAGFAITRSDDAGRTTGGDVVDGNTLPIATANPDGTDAGSSTPSAAAETFPPAGTTPENFLIVGSDANACVDSNSPWAGASDPARVGSRSDTIMILRLDPTTNRASVLSFPRDLWVDIPGRGKGRINSAYVPNDYSLLAQTIYDNFAIVVDHYIQVDFCAFKRIIDAIGGVAVPFATPVIDRHVGLSITAPGCHTFSGDEALAYVRSRHLQRIDESGVAHPDPTADYGRILRQQDFLRRVLDETISAGLFDPAVTRALIESLETDVVTEAGFTIEDMLRFAGTLKNVDPSAIQQYRVEADPITVSDNAVLQPVLDTPTMTALLAEFRGEAPPASTPDVSTASTQPGPSQDPPAGAIAPAPDVKC
jgi:LCP family protein required for cell wall assembly